MKLENIAARNIKGLSFDLPLAQVNFIVGDNFVGKSARADAIRLLLVGHLPELGKTNAATFAICSGRELVVEGRLGARNVFRRWFAKGDAVKLESIVPAELGEGSDSELRVVLAAMLNAETYFALSERDRVQYVVDNIPGVGTGFDWEEFVKQLRDRLLMFVPGSAKAIDWLAGEIARARTEAAAADGFRGFTPSSLLEVAAGTIDVALSVAKANSVRMLRTAQGLSELRAAEAPRVDLASLEREKRELDERLPNLYAEKAKNAAAVDAARKSRAERAILKGKTENRARLEARLATARAAFAELSGKLVDLKPPQRVNETALVLEYNELTKQANELTTKKWAALRAAEEAEHVAKARSELAAEKAKGREIETVRARTIEEFDRLAAVVPTADYAIADSIFSELGEAKAGKSRLAGEINGISHAITANEAEAARLATETVCPYCGATGESWKVKKGGEVEAAIRGLKAKGKLLVERLEQVGAYERSLSERAERVRVERGEIEVRKNRMTELLTRREELDIRSGEIGGRELELEEFISKFESKVPAERASVEDVDEALAVILRRQTAVQQDINESRKRKDEFEAARRALEQQVNGVRDELLAIEGSVADVARAEEALARLPVENASAIEAVESVQADINVANDRLRAIEEDRRKAIGRHHDLERVAQADAAVQDSKIAEEVAKRAAEVVREKKAEVVAAAFEPLLALANSIFGSVLRTPLAYNAGEIGTWRDGGWVSHKTFSGTERALAHAAIQAALAARSPVKLMLLDELGRLDDANAGKLVRAVQVAIERGLIDQFVGVDTGRGLMYADVLEDGPRLTSQVVVLPGGVA